MPFFFLKCGAFCAALNEGKNHPFTLKYLFSLALALSPASHSLSCYAAARALEIQGLVIFQGQTGSALVNLEAQGNENGVGFSLSFDPSVVTYTGVSLGTDASSAAMDVNANQTANGRVGIILALPTDVSFRAGTRQLVKVNFQAVTAASVESVIAFTDQPVPRDVSDTNALSLVTTYVNATISLNPQPPAVTVSQNGSLVAAGTAATFTAAATGSGPLSYQWQFNNAPIAGATNSTYNIALVRATNSGSYVVVVSSPTGTVTSAPPALLAVLTWTNPAAIFYGTPLGSNQLNATATVPGQFAYAPTNGAVLNAGSNILSLAFTPTDLVDYSSFTDAVGLVVSPAPVQISSGLTANNKIYDGTTIASLSSNAVALAGVVPADAANVWLVTNGYTASFTTPRLGNNIVVVVGNLTLGGSAAANYVLTQPAGLTASIGPRPLTVMAMPNNKIYDGSTSSAATPTISSGALLGGDIANFSENYDNKNVGTGKTLTPFGAISDGNGGANYSVAFLSVADGTITARPLLVTATGVNKIYDDTPSASVALSDTRVVGDNLTESYTSAVFDDPNVGLGKPVTVSGISLSGLDAANYTFNTTTTTTANITAAPLAITASSTNKTYGQSLYFSGTEFTAVGLMTGDTVTNVTLSSSGTAATAPVAGSPYSIVVGGAAGAGLANYSIKYNNGSLVIKAATLVVTADNTNRIYGVSNPPFTGSLTGLQNGDNIMVSFACSATNTSPVGKYDIIPSLEDPTGKLDNYAVTLVNGLLTVTPAATSISATLLSDQTLLMSVPTASGSQYVLESKADFSAHDWNNVETNAGTGGVITFTNHMGSNSASFYRIWSYQ